MGFSRKIFVLPNVEDINFVQVDTPPWISGRFITNIPLEISEIFHFFFFNPPPPPLEIHLFSHFLAFLGYFLEIPLFLLYPPLPLEISIDIFHRGVFFPGKI